MSSTILDSRPPVSPAIRKYAKVAFEQQPPAHSVDDKDNAFETYLKQLDSPESSAALPVVLDASHPLSHYFISSSHNTYLSGNQLTSKSSANSYKDVLKRGCRCIEIDVWDGDTPTSSEVEGSGKNPGGDVGKLTGMLKRKLGRLRSRSNPDKNAETVDSPAGDELNMPTPWRTSSGRSEPLVYHGHTATSQISFRKVCEVVRNYAFRTTNLPLIVSLEVHCDRAQQEIMVELMIDYWGNLLVQKPEDFSDSTPLPSLQSLKGKILVKVKYVPPKEATEAKRVPKLAEHEPASDDSAEAVKKGKIIPELSSLGVFTRAFHFNGFDQPEATIPTHVFSLGENKLLSACEEQPESVLKHNRKYLMRAYPKGTRLRSSNLDPTPFWRFGIQMVALNFQKLDAAMMLNAAQFEGSGGWMLKPAAYLPVDGQQPILQRKTLDLSIRLYAGQGLGRPDNTPNVYVKCEVHVGTTAEIEQNQISKGGKNKGGERKLHSGVRHSADPDWSGEALDFKSVHEVVPELAFVRFKVMDDSSYQKDRLLGWACYRLDRMPQGLVLLHLRGEDSKPMGSTLLVSVRVCLDEKTGPERSW